VQCL